MRYGRICTGTKGFFVPQPCPVGTSGHEWANFILYVTPVLYTISGDLIIRAGPILTFMASYFGGKDTMIGTLYGVAAQGFQQVLGDLYTYTPIVNPSIRYLNLCLPQTPVEYCFQSIISSHIVSSIYFS
jgi:hypothetical protein